MAQETVAVIGATGAQGSSVLKSLSSAPHQYKLRGITRNPGSPRVHELQQALPSVEWVSADLSDIPSLQRALEGVDILFANTTHFQPEILSKMDSGDTDAEFHQGKALVDAAISQGVKHIIYSSYESPRAVSKGKYVHAYGPEAKHKIEQYIRARADRVRGYFVYAGFYFQNLLYTASWAAPEPSNQEERAVVFTYPIPGSVALPYFDVERDLGNTVQLILDNREKFEGEAVAAVEGHYTGDQLAEAYTRATGVPAAYRYGKLGGVDRREIDEMMDYMAEFGAMSELDTAVARNTTPRPFATLDGFWQRHASFRPQAQ
ncbi:NAD(P)-binding protein [Martensiomyces pterosporus]|nr:NAD(P)-binding protein [Martensiomyces pterosporus]